MTPKQIAPVDLRAPIEPDARGFEEVLTRLDAVLAGLPRPEKPTPGDLVGAVVHLILSEGLPCGHGQEALRRIEEAFVDRNEFRVTEAYEVAELLEDLDIPDLFARCATVREAVGRIYNDQNAVSLDFLRQALVSERKAFFQRAAGIPPAIARKILHVVSFEECAFSIRSTLRVQQRLGFDAKSEPVQAFLSALRERLTPFGHLPLQVGPDTRSGSPISKPPLCPTCLLLRLAPAGPKKK